MSERYHNSELLLERALKSIPLGTQTFSKSKTQYPYGVSPYFIKKGKGSHVWDVDDNEYIDFINGLASVTLGYNDHDVNAAVLEQLDNGVTFSLPHPLEFIVAEKIIEIVPCAEMVRFGKNGSDATAGAIRLARAYTHRDHVAVCGYHGWQDWYIGSTARNLGVPESTRRLTHIFTYNNIESLRLIFKQWPEQLAAVIMEPMNSTEPKNDFLLMVEELTHQNGALFIFDETITGFRYANGGAQEFFGITPDLATFGKGMSNGYPLSAVAGRADIMQLMEEVFFSFTFGGEALSLAAANATMTKLQEEPVLETMKNQGLKVIKGVEKLLAENGLQDVISITGHPSWAFLNFCDIPSYTLWELKTLFLQEMFSRGILILGTHNMNYCHSDEDIAILLHAYSEVLAIIREAIDNKSLDKLLRCKPLVPLFRLR
ncbi:aminotransferase class III-fold pyridoxal phosphate-dependent enzyme [Syntrophomonas wolfei]|uniref:Aminotransferase n=1 Tax=Syntrophomonas wolfei subsp. wolfei (strain DSM 2245B / Goettingen) TaxID=335541 RepID=Q0B0E9_SYNWW|nr:aminotransferase class III-fold pyridoxal phosphate-dependent enzyme [Syntrophomonas wolfei]ABI67555.1 aminotransferase [Syntrophomonas wolfei subsp. wolfei str. Goettingen G311]